MGGVFPAIVDRAVTVTTNWSGTRRLEFTTKGGKREEYEQEEAGHGHPSPPSEV